MLSGAGVGVGVGRAVCLLPTRVHEPRRPHTRPGTCVYVCVGCGGRRTRTARLDTSHTMCDCTLARLPNLARHAARRLPARGVDWTGQLWTSRTNPAENGQHGAACVCAWVCVGAYVCQPQPEGDLRLLFTKLRLLAGHTHTNPNTNTHTQIMVWKEINYGRMSETEKKMICSEVTHPRTHTRTTDCRTDGLTG